MSFNIATHFGSGFTEFNFLNGFGMLGFSPANGGGSEIGSSDLMISALHFDF